MPALKNHVKQVFCRFDMFQAESSSRWGEQSKWMFRPLGHICVSNCQLLITVFRRLLYPDLFVDHVIEPLLLKIVHICKGDKRR